MTNDVPERIWVWRNAPHGELVVSGPDVPRLTVSSEYIRKDVSDAAVAAEREACANVALRYLGYETSDDEMHTVVGIAQTIRARAALEESNDE